jgi:hypothetical protein
MHHRLTDLGLTPTAIVAMLVSVSLTIGFAAALSRRAHVPEPVFPAVYLAATLAYFLITRRAIRMPKLGEATRAEPAPVRARVERNEA